jgi:hypothetical protein
MRSCRALFLHGSTAIGGAHLFLSTEFTESEWQAVDGSPGYDNALEKGTSPRGA